MKETSIDLFCFGIKRKTEREREREGGVFEFARVRRAFLMRVTRQSRNPLLRRMPALSAAHRLAVSGNALWRKPAGMPDFEIAKHFHTLVVSTPPDGPPPRPLSFPPCGHCNVKRPLSALSLSLSLSIFFSLFFHPSARHRLKSSRVSAGETPREHASPLRKCSNPRNENVSGTHFAFGARFNDIKRYGEAIQSNTTMVP